MRQIVSRLLTSSTTFLLGTGLPISLRRTGSRRSADDNSVQHGIGTSRIFYLKFPE